MKLLIEGYSYRPEDVKGVLPDDTLWTPDEKIRIENVGYFHNPKCKDFVFFLPKVLLEPRTIDGKEVDRVFCSKTNPDGFAPEEILNPEQLKVSDGRKLADEEKSFLYEFAVWIYRAIARFDETHKSSDIINKRSESQAGSFKRRYVTNTLLDVILALRRFARDDQDYFLFKIKEKHSGANKINWTRTISKSAAILASGRPVYLDPRNKKRMIDFDEELLVIFYSILNYINAKFGFHVQINAGYELIAGEKFERYLAGYGCARLRQIKYKYFSDRDLALWELCFAFVDKAHQANVVSDREEYLLAKDFNIIFESIIDDLIGDGEVAAFKEMKDGKEIDHLYLDESLTTRGGSKGKTFYIADSKYYKLGNALSDESVYKQFTYAKNMLQLDLNLFLNGNAASDKVKDRRKPFEEVGLLRDPVTEGYDVIPNFFISATLDKEFSYDKPKLELHANGQNGEYRNVHFENRLFDRDTLILSHYDVNFLYVLKLYAQNDNGLKKRWRETVREEFRNRIRDVLKNRFLFYAMMPHGDTPSGERFLRDNFQKTLGKVYSPYRPVDGKTVYSLALEDPDKLLDDKTLSPTGLAEKKSRLAADKNEVIELLKTAFYVVPCELGKDPSADLQAEASAHPVAVGSSDISTFLRDVPIKGIQNAAVRAHFYPAPVESTHTPRIVRWILLSLSDHAPRMLRVRENGYLGGEWTGDQIKHTHAEFSQVVFPEGQKYHVWEVDEV
ncbi:MAG: LlaJI family restriction endonuclease [Kiritimatiellae bacterium]|nr:LlaJI family restriction endonuclease [Kiritimatiellia bacterium]